MKALAKAIRTHADTIEDTHTAELLRVLARLLEGWTAYKAFGAPGDWGYGQPIGDGVMDMLRTGNGDKRLDSAPAKSGAEDVMRAELIAALETADEALRECICVFLGSGKVPSPEKMAAVSGAISKILKKARAA